MSNPPHKKRRAKRTEEERIEYLRTDPYVAQFEAYRVLCASCDKWIRLRPNSTYCSIPWDAHRKSCLAKKSCVPVFPRFATLAGPANHSMTAVRAGATPTRATSAATSSRTTRLRSVKRRIGYVTLLATFILTARSRRR